MPRAALTSASLAGPTPAELETRMAEYMKLISKELRSNAGTPPLSRQGGSAGHFATRVFECWVLNPSLPNVGPWHH